VTAANDKLGKPKEALKPAKKNIKPIKKQKRFHKSAVTQHTFDLDPRRTGKMRPSLLNHSAWTAMKPQSMRKDRICLLIFTGSFYSGVCIYFYPFCRRPLCSCCCFYCLIFELKLTASWVLISTLPPGAFTFYDARVSKTHTFVLTLTKIVVSNYRNVGQFLTCFYLLTPVELV